MKKRRKTKRILPTRKLEDVIATLPDTIKAVRLATAIQGLPYKEVTIARFCDLMSDEVKNQKEIAQFVYDRFHQRYLLPFEVIEQKAPEGKSGFSQMATSCLMIEAMESFRNGWNNTQTDTDKSGGEIFEDFFNQYEEFNDFVGWGQRFYWSVRNGILHQAESKNGWHILRSGKLFDSAALSVNSTIFRRRMKSALSTYRDKLKNGVEPDWENFRVKMAHILQNCVP
jgi:hypothetical protein